MMLMIKAFRLFLFVTTLHINTYTRPTLHYYLSLFKMSICVLRLAVMMLLCWCFCMGRSPDCYEDKGGLTSDFYKESCPDAEAIILAWVMKAVTQDPRMAASLLRLHFHDCFVNGCDASVLLDDSPTLSGEKTAGPNLNSLRGFDLIDSIKCDLEAACPQTVSCADILAIAARDSVVLSGGPGWDVEMGRRDSFTANKTAANTDIPAPNSNIATLVSKFHTVGLDLKDMVALSGGHTIGRARCSTFTPRLLSTALAANVDPNFISSLQQLCSDSTKNNSTLAFLDLGTPSTFDNQYYVNLVSGEGLLQSDQVLMSVNSPTRPIVESYATDMLAFFQDFTNSMLKMGGINPLVGDNNGEIRRDCRTTN